MTSGFAQLRMAAVLMLPLAAGCATGDGRLVGTVTAVSPLTQTLTVRDAAGETVVSVDEHTHFWSGSGLAQIQTGDRVSLRLERQGDATRARSVEIFPAGRPRTRWIGPGGY
jgi:hypothetical protein